MVVGRYSSMIPEYVSLGLAPNIYYTEDTKAKSKAEEA